MWQYYLVVTHLVVLAEKYRKPDKTPMGEVDLVEQSTLLQTQTLFYKDTFIHKSFSELELYKHR